MKQGLKWLFQIDSGFPLLPMDELKMTEISEQVGDLHKLAVPLLEEPLTADYLATLEQLHELERQIAYENGFRRAFQICTDLYQAQ